MSVKVSVTLLQITTPFTNRKESIHFVCVIKYTRHILLEKSAIMCFNEFIFECNSCHRRQKYWLKNTKIKRKTYNLLYMLTFCGQPLQYFLIDLI